MVGPALTELEKGEGKRSVIYARGNNDHIAYKISYWYLVGMNAWNMTHAAPPCPNSNSQAYNVH